MIKILSLRERAWIGGGLGEVPPISPWGGEGGIIPLFSLA